MLRATVRNNSVIDKKPLFEKENHGLVTEKPLLQVIDNAVCNRTLTPIIAGNVKKL